MRDSVGNPRTMGLDHPSRLARTPPFMVERSRMCDSPHTETVTTEYRPCKSALPRAASTALPEERSGCSSVGYSVCYIPKPRAAPGNPVVHGLKGYYRGCRCAECRAAVAAYERRRAAPIRDEGFWIPCRCCGHWRHIHHRPTPSMVWDLWVNRVCRSCASSIRQSGRPSRAGPSWPRGPRMANRQMVSGGMDG